MNYNDKKVLFGANVDSSLTDSFLVGKKNQVKNLYTRKKRLVSLDVMRGVMCYVFICYVLCVMCYILFFMFLL